jgi:hypothetical protein
VCEAQYNTVQFRGALIRYPRCVKIDRIQVEQKQLTGRILMNVPGYDPKERFEFGVLTSFAYPIENTGTYYVLV